MRLITYLASPDDYLEGYYTPDGVKHVWETLSASVADLQRAGHSQQDAMSRYYRGLDIQKCRREYMRATALRVIPGGKQYVADKADDEIV